VGIVVLKELGVGTAAQAQPYLDKVVARIASLAKWPAAQGVFQTRRAAAVKWIGEQQPHFGILSLGAFLGLRGELGLVPIGVADVAGGRSFHVVRKGGGELASCKGKVLATTLAGDARFVDKVVFAGKLALADFTVVDTKRPIATVNAVVRGEAECALVDDSQLADLRNIEGAGELAPVWSSAKLPPMVVVAFPSAPAAERSAFQSNLGKICTGEGASLCREIGIEKLEAAKPAAVAGVIAAYGG
jgi:hypothetical protein